LPANPTTAKTGSPQRETHCDFILKKADAQCGGARTFAQASNGIAKQLGLLSLNPHSKEAAHHPLPEKIPDRSDYAGKANE
jgi:hypothetical protein